MKTHRVSVERQTWENTPPFPPQAMYRASCSTCGWVGVWHSFKENVESTCPNAGLSKVMERALLRFVSAGSEPDTPWGVREGTRIALEQRGLIENVLMRTKHTNQPFLRYRRTVEGDRVAAEISALTDAQQALGRRMMGRESSL